MPSRFLTLASIGFLTLVAAPTVSQVDPLPPDDKSGGFAVTDRELGALGRLAEMPDASAKQRAIRAYNLGLEYQDKASKLEEQAATTEGKKAARKADQAEKAYRKAIGQFRAAIEHVPDFHQALGCLGYALLRTGEYEEALDAYDRALEIGPVYAAAIEERGEVYLGLDRIEEAKSAYMKLTWFDLELAAELMSAMKRWLDRRRDDAGDLSDTAIEDFAVWIEKRSARAAQG